MEPFSDLHFPLHPSSWVTDWVKLFRPWKIWEGSLIERSTVPSFSLSYSQGFFKHAFSEIFSHTKGCSRLKNQTLGNCTQSGVGVVLAVLKLFLTALTNWNFPKNWDEIPSIGDRKPPTSIPIPIFSINCLLKYLQIILNVINFQGGSPPGPAGQGSPLSGGIGSSSSEGGSCKVEYFLFQQDRGLKHK